MLAALSMRVRVVERGAGSFTLKSVRVGEDAPACVRPPRSQAEKFPDRRQFPTAPTLREGKPVGCARANDYGFIPFRH